MYGTQTSVWSAPSRNWFENDVKMYGTQTYGIAVDLDGVFENDVKMYGTQTAMGYEFQYVSLRMM